jgi:putative endonuclease
VKDAFAHKYWVYIVASATGTLYTGMTGDLFKRIMQHRAGEIDGFSKTYKWDRLVWYESCDNVHRMISREKQIKSWRREKKIALIEKTNPRWEDLAEHWGRETLFPGQSMKKSR